MLARIAADAVLILHLAFIAFVMLGALFALRWRWLAVVHLPAAVWGAFVEISGRTCPLTFVENALRAHAGASGYEGGFIEHYLLAVLYPDGLTREMQWMLAVFVLTINGALYAWLLHRARAVPPMPASR